MKPVKTTYDVAAVFRDIRTKALQLQLSLDISFFLSISCPFSRHRLFVAFSLQQIYIMDMPVAKTTGAYPATVALGLLSFFTVILDLPPLLWHARNRNIAAALLISWIVVINLLSLLNVFIWPNDNTSPPSFHDGQGLCDIEVKLLVGRTTALPAATFCILKGLADVMNTKKITLGPSPGKEWKTLVFNLGFGLGIPAISMVLHYIVQTARYGIVGISGCAPVFFQSGLGVVLLDLPPLLLTAVDVWLCRKPSFHPFLYYTDTTSRDNIPSAHLQNALH